MAVVCVRGPLRKLAGDVTEHELPGESVVELLAALEERHPAIRGWILDERGRIRRHLHVFLGGELATEGTAVRPQDRVELVQAITGG